MSPAQDAMGVALARTAVSNSLLSAAFWGGDEGSYGTFNTVWRSVLEDEKLQDAYDDGAHAFARAHGIISDLGCSAVAIYGFLQDRGREVPSVEELLQELERNTPFFSPSEEALTLVEAQATDSLMSIMITGRPLEFQEQLEDEALLRELALTTALLGSLCLRLFAEELGMDPADALSVYLGTIAKKDQEHRDARARGEREGEL